MLDYNAREYNHGNKKTIVNGMLREYYHERGCIFVMIIDYTFLEGGYLAIKRAQMMECLDEEDAYNEICKVSTFLYLNSVNFYLWRLNEFQSAIVNSPYPTTTACMILKGPGTPEKIEGVKQYLESHHLKFEKSQLM
ncbi:hypothetical protein JEZ13_07740 [bacterium]|nr:hypothetical protein [bacterium]